MSVNIYNGTTGQLDRIAGREDVSKFVGTTTQWNNLTALEKAAYTGKEVWFTDDEEEEAGD